MKKTTIHSVLNYCIAAVWMINGFFCKILNLVPGHEMIVSSILGSDYARLLTLAIGILEVAMAFWILSRFKSKLNAITQIIIVTVMNTLEFILEPELLLWGRFNALFAGLLILTIYYNAFILNKNNS